MPAFFYPLYDSGFAPSALSLRLRNLGMTRLIVTKFDLRFRDQVTTHITQVMDGVHLHVHTFARAYVPPSVSRKRLYELS